MGHFAWSGSRFRSALLRTKHHEALCQVGSDTMDVPLTLSLPMGKSPLRASDIGNTDLA
jgi:hypothetical protein